MDPSHIAFGVSGFILGFLLAWLISRRGRNIKINWHLDIESHEEITPYRRKPPKKVGDE